MSAFCRQRILTPANIVVLCLIMAALYGCSLFSFLLFHTLVELFSIVIAFGIFTLAWNSRQTLQNNYLLFVGIAYLFVGFFDLFHAIAYQGMGVFPASGANLAAQLWVATRYVESLSLLIAPVFLTRGLRPFLLTAAFAVITGALLWTIHAGVFPACFVQGIGLTAFKKGSEYAISAILLGAFVFLFLRRRLFEPEVFQLIAASIFFTVGSELAFTFYVSVFGFSNLVGHFLKFLSFYMIYKAVIETGLRRPHDLLVRNLREHEETLRRSEQEFRSMFELSAVGMAEIDPADGRFVRVNQEFCRITGYSGEELSGLTFSDITHPEDRLVDFENYLRTLRGEERSWISEKRYIRKEGVIIWVKVTGTVLFDESGQPFRAVEIIADITGRREAEAATRNHLLRLTALLDCSASVLAAQDTNVMLQTVVDSAVALTGARRGICGHGSPEGISQVGVRAETEDAAPCPSGEVFAIERGGVYTELLERNATLMLSGEQLLTHPKWRGLPEGHAPLGGLLGVSLVGRDGESRGLVMVTDKRDGEFTKEDEITVGQLATLASLGLQNMEAREEAEEKAREAEDGRQRLSILMQELERSNNDLQQFAYIVSHDLQEPLRTVTSFVQLLGRRYEGKLDKKADQYIGYAVEGTRHMQRLLNDLLAFSRIGGGQLDLRPIDLSACLERARLNLKTAFEESRAALVCEGLPVVEADEMQMTQVFQNLIANAVKFRGERTPVITVSSERRSNAWAIHIRDNGIGIDPQHRDQVFLVFRRLHGKGRYAGTGIGLAICKKIVERHGGRIWVESEAGKGSCFSFLLPARRGDDDASK
jgi:PAS domain S-box-containing protein